MTSSASPDSPARSCAGTCPNPCSSSPASDPLTGTTTACTQTSITGAPEPAVSCCGPDGCEGSQGCDGGATYLPGLGPRATALVASIAGVLLLVGLVLGHLVGAILLGIVALAIVGPLARGPRFFSLPEKALRVGVTLLLLCLALLRW